MSRLLWIAATGLFLGAAAGAHAATLSGSFSATATETSGTSGYTPSVTFSGNALETSGASFTLGLLGVNQTTPTKTFVAIGPKSGSASVGTIQGTVTINFNSLMLGTATVSSVLTTVGHTATLSNGNISVTANYELFYGTSPQTDCTTFSSTTCTTMLNGTVTNTVLGDVLAVTFTDGSVVDINLYNWSDWTMYPLISFTNAGTTVTTVTNAPEPASIALLTVGAASLVAARRRRKTGA